MGKRALGPATPTFGPTEARPSTRSPPYVFSAFQGDFRKFKYPRASHEKDRTSIDPLSLENTSDCGSSMCPV